MLWCALRMCAVNWEWKPGACCFTTDIIFSVNGDATGPAEGAFDMDDTLDEGRHEGVSDTLGYNPLKRDAFVRFPSESASRLPQTI